MAAWRVLIAQDVLLIYEGSDGDKTRALYARLQQAGGAGCLAVDVFRATKASARAKVYRGGGFKGKAYERKQWSMNNLCDGLTLHARLEGIRWGWKADPAQEFYPWVLYVELPTGQVSFHSPTRGIGPDYEGEWDGVRDVAPVRIAKWIARLLAGDGGESNAAGEA